jgi:hypothetical protein
MARSEPDLILHGTIGGIIAGAVVVGWFAGVDVVAGQPFHTPARLASIVLSEEFRGPWPRLITVFTVLHFGVFVLLGVAATAALKLFDLDPGLALGAVFGVGVFNAVHYTGLLVTGTNLLTVVPVPHVAAANLLGGMLMMAYLHRALRAESPLGWNVLKRYPLVYTGVVTGLVGAAVVAFWFFAIDLAAGSPFRTPAALGSAVLLGARGPVDVQINLGVIAAYSVLHLLAFALVGIAFAWLASHAKRAQNFWLRALVVLVVLEALFLGTLVIVSGWVVENVGWAGILTANVLAVVAMGLWIWWRHPKEGGLRQQAAET